MSDVKYYAEVTYDLTDHEWGSLDDQMEKLANRHRGSQVGGGTGFGVRDQEYEFPSQEDSEAFVAAVYELALDGVEASPSVWEE